MSSPVPFIILNCIITEYVKNAAISQENEEVGSQEMALPASNPSAPSECANCVRQPVDLLVEDASCLRRRESRSMEKPRDVSPP